MDDRLLVEKTDEVQQEQSEQDLPIEKTDNKKKTTKSIRITEETKKRFNRLEQQMNLSQEDFTKYMLDIFEDNYNECFSNNSELRELQNIMNRIPEIFAGIISRKDLEKQRIENISRENSEHLEIENEQLKERLSALDEKYLNDTEKLKQEHELLMNKMKLEVSDRNNQIKELEDQAKSQSNLIADKDKELKETKDKLSNYIIEQGRILEASQQKDSSISELNSQIMKTREELIACQQEVNELKATINLHNGEIEKRDFKIEVLQQNIVNQKEMYEQQIKYLTDTQKK